MKPLAVDLFCGLGGFTSGLLSAGWRVIGFDIERHAYGSDRYPAQLVLQDVLTIHGRQFRNADLIVASPPCTEFSYMAMPWSRAKQIAKALRGQGEFPEGYKGSRTIKELTALFDATFRIHSHTRHLTNQAEHDAVKQAGDWFNDPDSPSRQVGISYTDKMLGANGPATKGSKSSARKAASARIAKIPPRLAAYIAQYYLPESAERVA